ncbi:NUDIX domain-containing protein [Luteimonas terrae]|uniref:ADP-ribose pyrophosphatase YjhB (NUDIX family) n=1 Tax=Luteimonas terrae TaxID=1530191 RepID=A0ABU1XSW3_9GAMM|nr:NUDIX domain-containing protein [Luteimonas terrae]MDR7191849.1 ADP-ribose pyrophosphatase YjhB (NUDIX family) [Luteimonas terrae]
MRLITELVHPALATREGRVLRRHAARAIVQRETSILLLYTERYDDFSFPGGGIADGEAPVAALHRELAEETGAMHIHVLRDYGVVEEYRPERSPAYDLMHMTSHFYVCAIDATLGDVRMEPYEQANGMRPVWVDLQAAIAHNRAVLQRADPRMGLSIHRETFMLEHVAADAGSTVVHEAAGA